MVLQAQSRAILVLCAFSLLHDRLAHLNLSEQIGEKVTNVDTEQKTVTTSKGRSVKYDHCVFSTGSAATYPPYLSDSEVEDTDGIFVYRSIGDLEKILDYGEKDHCKHACVVGGGLLVSHNPLCNRQRSSLR